MNDAVTEVVPRGEMGGGGDGDDVPGSASEAAVRRAEFPYPPTIGHYDVLSEVARGGMGIIYRAVDRRLDRTVAIKVLQSFGACDGEQRARFLREAKTMARLGKHPHLVQVHEVGLEGDRDY